MAGRRRQDRARDRQAQGEEWEQVAGPVGRAVAAIADRNKHGRDQQDRRQLTRSE
jgi:hypothetical protein